MNQPQGDSHSNLITIPMDNFHPAIVQRLKQFFYTGTYDDLHRHELPPLDLADPTTDPSPLPLATIPALAGHDALTSLLGHLCMGEIADAFEVAALQALARQRTAAAVAAGARNAAFVQGLPYAAEKALERFGDADDLLDPLVAAVVAHVEHLADSDALRSLLVAGLSRPFFHVKLAQAVCRRVARDARAGAGEVQQQQKPRQPRKLLASDGGHVRKGETAERAERGKMDMAQIHTLESKLAKLEARVKSAAGQEAMAREKMTENRQLKEDAKVYLAKIHTLESKVATLKNKVAALCKAEDAVEVLNKTEECRHCGDGLTWWFDSKWALRCGDCQTRHK